MRSLLLAVCVVFVACSSPTDSSSTYSPPADHTLSKGGYKHKTGLYNPVTNCSSCHGTDLRGGDEANVSCYECHGNKW